MVRRAKFDVLGRRVRPLPPMPVTRLARVLSEFVWTTPTVQIAQDRLGFGHGPIGGLLDDAERGLERALVELRRARGEVAKLGRL